MMALRVRSVAAAVLLFPLALVPCAAWAEDPSPRFPALDDAALAALALALAVAPVPEEAGWPADAPAALPEVELYANVTARTLVFELLPRVRLAFGGGPRRAVWRVQRVNLPARVEPGLVYRDVEVRLTLAGTADAIESLLRDARLAAAGIRIEPDPGAVATPDPTNAAAAVSR
jgi:hypothetical protein